MKTRAQIEEHRDDCIKRLKLLKALKGKEITRVTPVSMYQRSINKLLTEIKTLDWVLKYP